MFLLRSADVRRKTFSVFVVFLIIFIKVCRRTSEDLSVFVVFLIFLFYFSLQQIFSNGFSVISHPILIKFNRFIVLDERKSLNIISSQYDQGSGQGVVPKFYYAL